MGKKNNCGDGTLAILDTASGPGEPAATLARALPGSTVISTDCEDTMVEKAEKVASKIRNMIVRKIDMTELSSAFAPDTFDFVTCCLGLVYPSDKALAFSQALQVLKPGGYLIAVVWQDFRLLTLNKEILEFVVGEKLPVSERNPLCLEDEALFRSLAEHAGFAKVSTSTHTFPFIISAENDMLLKAATYKTSSKLDELGDDAWEKAKERLKELLPKYIDKQGESYSIPGNRYTLMVSKKID